MNVGFAKQKLNPNTNKFENPPDFGFAKNCWNRTIPDSNSVMSLNGGMLGSIQCQILTHIFIDHTKLHAKRKSRTSTKVPLVITPSDV